MQNNKRTVNAKEFVKDYRRGKDRAGLMKDYALSPASFEKLVQVLVQKNLLSDSDAQSLSEPSSENHDLAATSGVVESAVTTERKITTRKEDPESICPQCSAEVGRRTLICPECGHILPGEDRWQSLDQEKGVLSRIPRKALGWALVVPTLVAMFFVFKDVVVPLTRLKPDKGLEVTGKRQPADSAAASPRVTAEAVSTEAIDQEIAELIADGTLSAASHDKSALTTGAIWEALGQEDRSQIIIRLREAFRASGLPPKFELLDPFGKTVAQVNDTSIEFMVSEEASSSAPTENKVTPSSDLSPDLGEQVGNSIPSESPPGPSSPEIEAE